jgi:hypothetical protein
MMGLALAGIFYSMRYMRSQEFIAKTQSPDSPLSILLGTDGAKAYNWCPTPLKSLSLFSQDKQVSSLKPLTTAADWAVICEILTEPVAKEDAGGSFRNIVMALPEGGEAVYLEQNDKGVFRVLRTSFRSQSLAKALKRYEF